MENPSTLKHKDLPARKKSPMSKGSYDLIRSKDRLLNRNVKLYLRPWMSRLMYSDLEGQEKDLDQIPLETNFRGRDKESNS